MPGCTQDRRTNECRKEYEGFVQQALGMRSLGRDHHMGVSRTMAKAPTGAWQAPQRRHRVSALVSWPSMSSMRLKSNSDCAWLNACTNPYLVGSV